MSSFAKLDSGIVDSTLWMQPHDVLRVWVAMLAKADASGYVRASVPSMAHLCMVPIERLETILKILVSPDPYSRTPDDDGRRIREVDGGWELINYLAYRNSRDTSTQRERKREWDRKNRPSGHARAKKSDDSPTTVRDSPTQSDPVLRSPTQAEAEAEAEKTESAIADLSGLENPDSPNPTRKPCPHDRIIAAYHELLPELRQIREWNETRKRLLARRWAESAERQSLDWWREFFGYVRKSRFLMGHTTGRDGRPFDCDLEWLIRPTNFAKVVEGKYEDAP